MNSASWAVVTFSGIAPACSHGRVGRDRDGGSLVHDEPLGLAAAGQHRHHPVADGEPGGAWAQGDDLTGGLEPGDVDRRTRRRRVEAGALEEVGVADARRPHRHRDLARRRALGRGAPATRARHRRS